MTKLKKQSKSINIFSRFNFKGGREYFIITVASLVGAVFLALVLINFMISFGSQEATLYLAYENNGQGRMFSGRVIEDMTVLDALLTSAEAGHIKLEYVLDTDNKIKIVSLDGYNDSYGNNRLNFYLNNKRIEESNIHLVVIEPGDVVRIDLE